MQRWVLGSMIGLCLLGVLFESSRAQPQNVRIAVVAGQFYPGDQAALTKQVQDYLAQAPKIELSGTLHALVAPHAGYIYSGPIAAYAYKQITKPFKRVFIFGSNHSPEADFDGLSVPAAYTHYATLLGEVRVSPLVQKLTKVKGITYAPAAHSTHVEEVQLPFLQTVLPDFEIIPVITGRLDLADIKRFGELFNSYADDATLFIVSSDLSHYHPYDEAVRLDTACTHALEQVDSEGVINSELCGQGAALILLEIAKKQGWQGKILNYRNSGDTAGDKNRVVGYGAIAYYTPASGKPGAKEEAAKLKFDASGSLLSEEEQKLMLELAKTTIDLYVKEKKVFEPDPANFIKFPKLSEQRGTFVTLKENGDLRGCIGDLIGRQPLYLGVRDHAINAAARDPRFTPVTPAELPKITLSISVLDAPQLMRVEKSDDYVQKLTPQDGVILTSGSHTSTYLPQVWEQIPNPVDFLNQLCLKGGSPADCWKRSETQLYTYHAQEFGAK